MRKIELHTKTVEFQNQSKQFVYRDELTDLLRMPHRNKLDIVAMRDALAVIDKLRQADEYVLLEEVEWENLRERVSDVNWPFAHPVFVEFYNDIHHAPRVGVVAQP